VSTARVKKLKARDELLVKLRQDAIGKISTLADSPQYPAIMTKLITQVGVCVCACVECVCVCVCVCGKTTATMYRTGAPTTKRSTQRPWGCCAHAAWRRCRPPMAGVASH
jgi:hypothetical protein